MTCKACARVRSAIRRWLGIDEILTKQGQLFTKYVDTQCANVQKSCAAAHEKISALTAAGEQLESTISALDEANSLLHRETLEKFDAFRAINAIVRSDIREARNASQDAQLAVSELGERLHKLEFPGFEPVESSRKKDG